MLVAWQMPSRTALLARRFAEAAPRKSPRNPLTTIWGTRRYASEAVSPAVSSERTSGDETLVSSAKAPGESSVKPPPEAPAAAAPKASPAPSEVPPAAAASKSIVKPATKTVSTLSANPVVKSAKTSTKNGAWSNTSISKGSFSGTKSALAPSTSIKSSPIAQQEVQASRRHAFYQPTTVAHNTSTSQQYSPDVANGSSSAPIDWAGSFHGVSAKPVSEEQFKVLMQPISDNDIEVKPDGIIYLPEIKYRRRLNEAFGPMGWGMVPKGEPVVGNAIVTREYALFADGRFVAQAQGENGFFGRDQLPSAVEGCKSNALMRCCKDLGIGSELWDPHYIRWFKKTHVEEVWVENITTKKKRQFSYRKGRVEVAYPYKLAR